MYTMEPCYESLTKADSTVRTPVRRPRLACSVLPDAGPGPAPGWARCSLDEQPRSFSIITICIVRDPPYCAVLFITGSHRTYLSIPSYIHAYAYRTVTRLITKRTPC
jgi:hypothetical protein